MRKLILVALLLPAALASSCVNDVTTPSTTSLSGSGGSGGAGGSTSSSSSSTSSTGASGATCIPEDDDNTCTDDVCDDSGTTHAPLSDGTACTRTQGCVVGGTCQAGACVGGSVVTCGAGMSCVAGTCAGPACNGLI